MQWRAGVELRRREIAGVKVRVNKFNPSRVAVQFPGYGELYTKLPF